MPPKATSAGQKLLKHYLQVRRLEDDLFVELDESGKKGFTSIAVGINADSLAFWLMDAIHPFLLEELHSLGSLASSKSIYRKGTSYRQFLRFEHI